MKSIITNDLERCFVCGAVNNLHLHHTLFGNNRKKADEDGLVVPLCIYHHTGSNEAVHCKNGKKLDNYLKRTSEVAWLVYYNKTIKEFIERYGRNYLWINYIKLKIQ